MDAEVEQQDIYLIEGNSSACSAIVHKFNVSSKSRSYLQIAQVEPCCLISLNFKLSLRKELGAVGKNSLLDVRKVFAERTLRRSC
jgi:hypothetical protein